MVQEIPDYNFVLKNRSRGPLSVRSGLLILLETQDSKIEAAPPLATAGFAYWTTDYVQAHNAIIITGQLRIQTLSLLFKAKMPAFCIHKYGTMTLCDLIWIVIGAYLSDK